VSYFLGLNLSEENCLPRDRQEMFPVDFMAKKCVLFKRGRSMLYEMSVGYELAGGWRGKVLIVAPVKINASGDILERR